MALSGEGFSGSPHTGRIQGSGGTRMKRMGTIAGGVIFLVIIGILAVNPASAQPITAPAKITMPGVYELSEDARGITDIYGISIECSNVILDGGNHFLGGEEREKSVGVYVNQYGGSLTNVTVKNLILEKWAEGINYKYVKGQEGDTNLITTCDIVESDIAIHVEDSDYVQVVENQITGCPSAITVEGLSTYTHLKNNAIKNSGLGVEVANSRYLTIEENNINTCSVYGLEVVDSEYTTITRNGIGDNKYAAIRIENSKESEIIGNTLTKTETGPVLIIGNEVRYATITDNYFGAYEAVAVDEVSSEIVWNSTLTPGVNILGGPYMGGNYWGSAPGAKGFSDSAPDEDGFGIADKPYQINEYNIDYLPLTHTTATKAPEEQISSPVVNESVPSSDNLTEEGVTAPASEAVSGNVSPPSEIIPAPSENIESGTENSTNESPVQENLSPVLPVQNLTSQEPLISPAPVNSSIMNRSITNSYPTDDSGVFPVIPSPEPGLSGVDQIETPVSLNTTPEESIPGEIRAEDLMVNKSLNQSSVAQVGYLLFNISEPNSQVILTTANGITISLDPTPERSIIVPVQVEGLVYSMYRVEKDDFSPVTGNISSYPASGQTITIPVTMIRIEGNSSHPGNQSSLNNSVSSLVSVPGPVNTTSAVAAVITQPEESKNQSSVTIPVTPNNTEPVVITNGVVFEPDKKTTHMIKASAGSGGSIFPNGDVPVLDEGSVAFIIEPNDGRRVAYLVVDGIQTGPMSEYRFIGVTTDHTIAAGFT